MTVWLSDYIHNIIYILSFTVLFIFIILTSHNISDIPLILFLIRGRRQRKHIFNEKLELVFIIYYDSQISQQYETKKK